MAKELSFYDLKAKKKFNTSSYKEVTRGKRLFAVAKGKDGNECWRVLGAIKK